MAALLFGGHWMIGHMIRQMVYPAPPVRVPSPPPPPLEEVWLESGGDRLLAWWLPPPAERAGAPAVLMLHGNGENLETLRRAGLLEDFHRLGAGVLALDYPGYGRSSGTPGEAAIVDGAEAAWHWLEGLPDPGPKVLAGWSLGAAAAVQVAARRGAAVDGLILLSPWDSLAAVARLHFPALLVDGLLAERYLSTEAARQVAAPVLVVHGADDRIIPARLGRLLFEELAEPRRWVEVPGAGHNDLLAQRQVWSEIERFLAGLEAEGGGGAGTG